MSFDREARRRASGAALTTYPLPNPYPPAANTQSSYRLDPAHTNRQIFTTYSYSRTGAGLMPDQNQAQNQYAALGAVDLNRTLADYRDRPHAPLSPGNVVANSPAVTNAENDRQQFAMDIFARLIVSTGSRRRRWPRDWTGDYRSVPAHMPWSPRKSRSWP